MSHPIHRVTRFSIVGPYSLLVAFDDGTDQRIDFRPVLFGPLFGPLQEPATFQRPFTTGRTICNAPCETAAPRAPKAPRHHWHAQVDDCQLEHVGVGTYRNDPAHNRRVNSYSSAVGDCTDRAKILLLQRFQNRLESRGPLVGPGGD